MRYNSTGITLLLPIRINGEVEVAKNQKHSSHKKKDEITMSKRKRITTQSVIKRRVNEGRGKGHFSEYKSWLTIHDVPSQGVVTRILGWKSGRLHHYLSEHFELAHHYQMEWAADIIDIREQYPLLPLEKTIYIAERLGIKHPVDPRSKYPIVMTTDMLLTLKQGKDVKFIAHSIKPKSKLSKRALEKLELERVFFKDAGIEWALITEEQINYSLVRNVEWLHSAKFLDGTQVSTDLAEKMEPLLYDALQSLDKPLAKITLEYDHKHGFSHGTCMFIVRHLIANKLWLVDMSKRIIPTLQSIRVNRIPLEGGIIHGSIY